VVFEQRTTDKGQLTKDKNMTIEEITTKIKKLNSKAGQMKMDLHDLAEGLPTDYHKLMDVAAATYEIYCQLDGLKQQLKKMENSK
jgi:hypothetical protein